MAWKWIFSPLHLITTVFTFAFTGAGHAKSIDDCETMRTEQHQLALHAENLTGKIHLRAPSTEARGDYKSFNLAALRLRVLALNKRCGMSYIEDGAIFRINYPDSSEIASEVFHYRKDHEVESWRRTTAKGESQSAKFSADGKITSLE